MRVLVAGSRAILDYALVAYAIEHTPAFPVDHIVHGGAIGVDTLAGEWAKKHEIDQTIYPAKWKKYGRPRAGFIRNRLMAHNADALIAVWDGKSRGTKHMIDTARSLGLPVVIYYARELWQKVYRDERISS